MADWRVIESAREYETPWYNGGYDTVEQPDGTTKRYYWASLPPAVVVVPLLDGEDEAPLVSEHAGRDVEALEQRRLRRRVARLLAELAGRGGLV
jgi:ADP-ribose pyrophosphatase